MSKKLFYRSLNLINQTILLRVDFNCPLTPAKEVEDNSRIVASLPTINFLLAQNAKIIILSHLGRPEGKKVPEFSLSPVKSELEKLLKYKVTVKFAPDCQKASDYITGLKNGEILLLENLRFYPEEEKVFFS
jgi:3-phosphoglycerate kinase